MIIPTKTVCYAYIKDPTVLGGMIKRRIDRVKDDRVVTAPGPGEVFYIGRKYSEIERIVVREEPISIAACLLGGKDAKPKWYGGVLEEFCSKTFFPNSPCLCSRCNPMIGQSL